MDKKKQVQFQSISEVLAKSPSLGDERTLNLVDKRISVIDSLPGRFARIENLYLSHNSIEHLGGLSQFLQLRALSLGHNNISSLEELSEIRGLDLLEHINLEGNPVTTRPSYRLLVLSMFPHLKSLDTKPVLKSEREQAKLVLSRNTNYIDTILSFERKAAKLEMLGKRLRIRKELIKKGLLNSAAPINVLFYLSVVQLDWPKELVDKIKESLQEKVQEYPEDQEFAYTECIVTQQDYISHLEYQVECLIEDCNQAWSSPKRSFQQAYARNELFSIPETTDISEDRSESRLAKENADLKEKLAEFQATNKKNVKVAEEEFRRLNAQIIELKRINEANQAINNSQALQLNEALRKNQELKELGLDEDLEEAKMLYNIHLVARTMRRFKLGVSQSKKISWFSRSSREKRKLEAGKLGFAAWKWVFKVEKYIKWNTNVRTKKNCNKMFAEWKKVTQNELIANGLVIKKIKLLAEKCFFRLKAYPSIKLKKEMVKDKAKSFHSETLIRKSFLSLIDYLESSNFSCETEHILLARAVKVRHFILCKKYFSAMKNWHHNVVFPAKRKLQKAQKFRETSLKYRSFSRFYDSICKASDDEHKAKLHYFNNQRSKALRVMKYWRKYVFYKAYNTDQSLRFYAKKLFCKLKKAVFKSKRLKKLSVKAIIFHEKFKQKTVFCHLKRITLKLKKLKSIENKQKLHMKFYTAKKYLLKWFVSLQNTKFSDTNAARSLFADWRLKSHRGALARSKKHSAHLLYQAKLKLLAQKIIHSWNSHTKSVNLKQQVADFSSKKSIKFKQFSMFFKWQQQLLKEYAFKLNQSEESQRGIEQELQDMQDKLLDKKSLIEKYEDLSREFQKALQENDNLRLELDMSTNAESDYKNFLKQSETDRQALQEENQSLNRKLKAKDVVIEKLEEKTRDENSYEEMKTKYEILEDRNQMLELKVQELTTLCKQLKNEIVSSGALERENLRIEEEIKTLKNQSYEFLPIRFEERSSARGEWSKDDSRHSNPTQTRDLVSEINARVHKLQEQFSNRFK